MMDLESMFEKVDQNYRHDIVLLEAFGSEKVDICFWLPSLAFWIGLGGVSILSILVSFLPSFIIYKAILPNSKSTNAYIIGYGMVIPFCVYFPILVLDYFDIRNSHLRFTPVFCSALWLFRTMEAMYGFAPPGAKRSLISYYTYYTTLGVVMYDPKTHTAITPKLHDIVSRTIQFVIGMIALGSYCSLLHHYDYELFDTDVAINSMDHTIWDILSFRHIVNNFSIALLLQGYLLVFTIPMNLLANTLFFVEVQQYMKNAMFDAKSPSDFWGNKWNLLIHHNLKNGVYKPARTYFSSTTAIMCTFLASGLFHEWILIVTYHITTKQKDEFGNCHECYTPDTYGKNLLFFVWNGMIMGMEVVALRHFTFFQRLGKVLPPLLRTMMIIMLSLPVGHWLFGDTVVSGFFAHSQMGLPMIVLKKS